MKRERKEIKRFTEERATCYFLWKNKEINRSSYKFKNIMYTWRDPYKRVTETSLNYKTDT